MRRFNLICTENGPAQSESLQPLCTVWICSTDLPQHCRIWMGCSPKCASPAAPAEPQQQWASCLEWNTHSCGIQQRGTDWNKHLNRWSNDKVSKERRWGEKGEWKHRIIKGNTGRRQACGRVEGLRRAVVAGARSSWNTDDFWVIFICLFKQSIWSFFLFSLQAWLKPASTDTAMKPFLLLLYLPASFDICAKLPQKSSPQSYRFIFSPIF